MLTMYFPVMVLGEAYLLKYYLTDMRCMLKTVHISLHSCEWSADAIVDDSLVFTNRHGVHLFKVAIPYC